MNFQDVIRESYDASNKALKANIVSGSITASSQVTVTLQNTPTIYAVVNTSAAGDSVNNIGFATVAISNPTLYAVVNTGSAVLSGNITLADTRISGSAANVTTHQGLPVWAVRNGSNSALTDTEGDYSPISVSDTGSVYTEVRDGYIKVHGNISSGDADSGEPIKIGGKYNSTPITLDNGDRGDLQLDSSGRLLTSLENTPTVYIGTPTLYAVVNTGAAGVGNSIVTIANLPLTTQIVGNVTISDSKGYIGLVTVTQASSVRSLAGNVTLDAGSKTGLVGTVTIQDGGNSITVDGNVGITGNVSISSNIAWPDPKGYIGLVTITGSLSAPAGNVTLDPGSKTGIVGNLTLSDPKGFIGLVTIGGGTLGTSFAGNVTLDPGSKTQIVGNITLSDPKGFIGLVTIGGGTIGTTFAGNVTLDAGSRTGLVGTVTIQDGGNSITIDGNVGVLGNVTITDSKGFIGLVTSVNGASDRFIGLVTVVQSSALRSIAGNLTLSDSKTFIGLVSVGGGVLNTVAAVTDITNPIAIKGNMTLSDSKTYIGLVSNTIGAGDRFIGLVTAWTRNAGTSKTLVSLPVGLGNNSLATIAVPTNANKINVTNFLLSSNITTEIALKSGVTYLTGNASLGVTLFPGGGFELPGAPDSPSWIGLPSGALVVEKRDPGGTVSKIGGGLIYFDE